MRCLLQVLFVALFAATPLCAQDQPSTSTDQAAIVAFAQKAAVSSLNFRQGDRTSLTQARADFTDEGWKNL